MNRNDPKIGKYLGHACHSPFRLLHLTMSHAGPVPPALREVSESSNRLRRGACAAVAAALLVCSVAAAASGGAEVDTAFGEVVVLITDHRLAIDDFSSLVVQLDGARLHRRGRLPGEGWATLETARREVDLTRYKDGATVELLRGTIPAVRYDAVDLLAVPTARGVVLSGDFVDVPLEISPLRVDIEVRSDRVTQLTFDLVVYDLRDHPGKTWGVLLDEVRIAEVPAAPVDGGG